MLTVVWQEFYEFVSEVSGIENFNIINIGGLPDALLCEVSLTSCVITNKTFTKQFYILREIFTDEVSWVPTFSVIHFAGTNEEMNGN